MFTVVSSFIPVAQEDDALKNVRLKSTLSFVRITSMAEEEGVEFSFANHPFIKVAYIKKLIIEWGEY